LSASKLASYSRAAAAGRRVGLYLDDLLDATRQRVAGIRIHGRRARGLAVALIALPSLQGSVRTRDVIGSVPAAQDGSRSATGLWVSAAVLIGAALVFLLPNRGRIGRSMVWGSRASCRAHRARTDVDDASVAIRRTDRRARTSLDQNYRRRRSPLGAQPVNRVAGDEDLAALTTTGAGWVILVRIGQRNLSSPTGPRRPRDRHRQHAASGTRQLK
jgi:hypothetical protein